MHKDIFERRQAERHTALNLLDFEVLSADGVTVGRGLARTLNLSASGLLLETGQFLDPGQTLRITLGLGNTLIPLTGRVVHSQPLNDELCASGIQYVEFDPVEQEILQRYFAMVTGAAES